MALFTSYCWATIGATYVSVIAVQLRALVAVDLYTFSMRSLGRTYGHMNSVKHMEHGTRKTSAANKSVRRRPHARPYSQRAFVLSASRFLFAPPPFSRPNMASTDGGSRSIPST